MKKIGIALSLWLALSTSASARDFDDYTEYDFEDDLVHGDLVRPDGELVTNARRFQHISLIRIRTNFIDRLLWSAETL